MNTKTRSLTEIHIAVLFFGLAGLFGKLISLPPLAIVFGRVFFASLFLIVLLRVQKQKLRLENRRDAFFFVLLGLVLTIHWVTFFLSIQLSTVAIGLLTFSVFPVFVTFMEPLFFKTRVHPKDVLTALITFFGVALVIPSFHFESAMTQGALWGVVSGFAFAILSILNKNFVSRYPSPVISFYQSLVSALILLPFIGLMRPTLEPKNLILLAILGVIFTGVSHTLFINGMKHVKAQTASIIASLEPVYGIIAALILLGEVPSGRAILGGLIILGTAAYSTFQSNTTHS